ncbi:VOC family protein [Rhodococcoides fascians]|uniref:VOC family protein n=1 Tax=Rhodococcoides fascians TaxID=1828 RepID=UPI001E480198|nr:VOC family protein [Rhodococcus fascians]
MTGLLPSPRRSVDTNKGTISMLHARIRSLVLAVVAVLVATMATVLMGTGAFQRAPDFTPIDWPSEGIKIHLDLVVDDMEQARDFVVDAGATLIDHAQSSFWVYRDPAGHIFCLCKRK